MAMSTHSKRYSLLEIGCAPEALLEPDSALRPRELPDASSP